MFFSQRVRDAAAVVGYILTGLVAAGLLVYIATYPRTVVTVWVPLVIVVVGVYLLYRLVVAVEQLAETM